MHFEANTVKRVSELAIMPGIIMDDDFKLKFDELKPKLYETVLEKLLEEKS